SLKSTAPDKSVRISSVAKPRVSAKSDNGTFQVSNLHAERPDFAAGVGGSPGYPHRRECKDTPVATYSSLRCLRLFAVGHVEGCLEAARESNRVVVRPEMHVEQTRAISKRVVVDGRHLDAVLAQRLRDWIDFARDEDEVTRNGRFAIAGRLE